MAFVNRYPPTRTIRYRTSWGPSSVRPQWPFSEEEDTSSIHEQMDLMMPHMEDLAEWINKHTNSTLTAETLLDGLDNGVIVLYLAKAIQEKMRLAHEEGTFTGAIPTMTNRIWENVARRSFFCRDNVENFINFCRQIGVHDNLLFESDDLVLQNQPRNVILCLMEVGRIAGRFNLEPPTLVKFEREIEEEQNGDIEWGEEPSPSDSSENGEAWPENRLDKSERRASNWTGERVPANNERLSNAYEEWRSILENAGEGASDDVPSDSTDEIWSGDSTEDPDEPDTHTSSPSPPGSKSSPKIGAYFSELDFKVRRATEEAQKLCQCPSSKCIRLKVRKVGEGRYHIAGRNVFIRALNDEYTMVRVGGGWDTLPNFLRRHDPCQVRKWGRDGTVMPLSRSLTSTPIKFHSTDFLHIKAKYCSPSTPKSHTAFKSRSIPKSLSAPKSFSTSKLLTMPKSFSTPKSLSSVQPYSKPKTPSPCVSPSQFKTYLNSKTPSPRESPEPSKLLSKSKTLSPHALPSTSKSVPKSKTPSPRVSPTPLHAKAKTPSPCISPTPPKPLPKSKTPSPCISLTPPKSLPKSKTPSPSVSPTPRKSKTTSPSVSPEAQKSLPKSKTASPIVSLTAPKSLSKLKTPSPSVSPPPLKAFLKAKSPRISPTLAKSVSNSKLALPRVSPTTPKPPSKSKSPSIPKSLSAPKSLSTPKSLPVPKALSKSKSLSSKSLSTPKSLSSKSLSSKSLLTPKSLSACT